MSSIKAYAVIMAGGKGTRFWPESTSQTPKQYLALFDNQTLIEQTLCRLGDVIPKNQRTIVTILEQESLARKLGGPFIHADGLVFEPEGRNTAPCILLALAKLEALGANPLDAVAVLPSDHVILNTAGFQNTLREAIQMAAEKRMIFTIGIPPSFPHTGYGYIKRGAALEGTCFKVDAFCEKPNKQVATEYLKEGGYYWNAGMFVGTLKCFLEEFEEHAPQFFQHYNDLKAAAINKTGLADVYSRFSSDSIDYALMEKSKKIGVIPARFDWNDLGSWDALESVVAAKENNFVAQARGLYALESKGNIVFARDKMVALIGINDLIVVSNDKSVLIMPKSRSQDAKKVVEHLSTKPEFKDLI